ENGLADHALRHGVDGGAANGQFQAALCDGADADASLDVDARLRHATNGGEDFGAVSHLGVGARLLYNAGRRGFAIPFQGVDAQFENARDRKLEGNRLGPALIEQDETGSLGGRGSSSTGGKAFAPAAGVAGRDGVASDSLVRRTGHAKFDY